MNAIVVPAYNEESTILALIHSLKEYGRIIIVDDCSTDNTYKLAQTEFSTVIHNTSNLGYDKSLNLGIAFAFKNGFEYVITCDADGQHPTSAIVKICSTIYANPTVDLVHCYRHSTQRFAEWVASHISQKIFKIRDPFSGLKCYKSSGFLQYKPPNFDSIGSSILLYALINKKSIFQIGYSQNQRIDEPRYPNGIAANIYILFCFCRTALHHYIAYHLKQFS